MAGAPAIVRMAGATTRAGAPRHVLLVEDDDSIADALDVHLGDAGYHIHREADGAAAIAVLMHRSWDFVLLDVMLPRASGFDVCVELRRWHAAVPVIMLSARADEDERVRGLELGADDYLAKPFSMRELVARMQALARRIEAVRRLPDSPEALAFAGYRLDLHARTLTGPDGQIPLTAREFELLAFIVQNSGRTYSRDELLHWVWGDAFDGYAHTVNSHINRLRAKIEADPKDPKHIITMWGVGYRFEPGAS
jgi:two-component system OmpR family response regulator